MESEAKASDTSTTPTDTKRLTIFPPDRYLSIVRLSECAAQPGFATRCNGSPTQPRPAAALAPIPASQGRQYYMCAIVGIWFSGRKALVRGGRKMTLDARAALRLGLLGLALLTACSRPLSAQDDLPEGKG